MEGRLKDLILAHGGIDMSVAGDSLRSRRRACASAWTVDQSVDAVVAGLGVLEDDPQFNAGYGSVLTVDGDVEVDAGVVNGQTGEYGAVAAVRGLRHPAAVAACVQAAGSTRASPSSYSVTPGPGRPTCSSR